MEAGSETRVVKTYKAVDEHLCCDLNGEAVILSLVTGKYYGVNAVGAAIWAMIRKPSTFKGIQEELKKVYEVDDDTCRNEVQEFLERMNSEGLIEIRDETVS